MEELDYWRLCDELNIVQAALLVAGEAPTLAQYIEKQDTENRPKGYEAAKTAIVHGLKKYALYQELDAKGNYNSEQDIHAANALLERSIQGCLVPEYETDMNGNQMQAYPGSVDLWRSTIEVTSLKYWLRYRGFITGFFFPEGVGDIPDYLDPKNPRYAPKLAASVHAWQAVTHPGKKSPKQALDKWLREHAAEFGLTDDEGNPVNQAIEDCSKIANWNQTGGAPKTPS